jgi:hypothetical protein
MTRKSSKVNIIFILVAFYLIYMMSQNSTPVSTLASSQCPRGKQYQQGPLEKLSSCDPGYDWSTGFLGFGGQCVCQGT